MFYRCFFVFFFFFAFFSFFSIRHKNTRQPFSGTAKRIFMKLLTNDSRENGVCINITKWGGRPPINFWGAKNYTLRTWWWRLASDWESVCWLWHCAATAVASKSHERANAFNLVFFRVSWKKKTESIQYLNSLLNWCMSVAYTLAANTRRSAMSRIRVTTSTNTRMCSRLRANSLAALSPIRSWWLLTHDVSDSIIAN